MTNKQLELIQPAVEARVESLLAQMTLAEKLGQLTQLGPSMPANMDVVAFMADPDPNKFVKVKRDFHEDRIRRGEIGSMLGVMGAEEINRLQKVAVEESRLGIPMIFGLDVIHGYRTIFPIPLAEACSWEPELARRTAEVAAREAAAAGLHWTFAPMVDVARDARWGRIAEGAGEDTYLGSAFARARVSGFQGEDFSSADHLAACAKHYIAYGAASAGRDYNTTEMALQTLHEVYLPPFEAASQSGALTFMSAFNELNGVPTSANHYTLSQILRGKLGFNGFVVSDYNSIGELIEHGYAADRADAAQKAITAGVDMDMMTQAYLNELEQLVQQGAVRVEVIDESVRRVLRVKFLLGLFERPYRSSSENEQAVQLLPEHLALAREAARRSIVLLKNEANTLPLRPGAQKILVTGPLADSPADMLGCWSFTGQPTDVVSILQGIRAVVGEQALYTPGCALNAREPEDFSQALAQAQAADVIVAVVGESATMSGEAASRMELSLPGNQEAFLKALHGTGKPLVVVLANGRPLALPWVSQNVHALLETWHLGVQAGPAVADVLFGGYNPSGRLVVSFPWSVGQEPLYYNRTSTGRPADPNNSFTSKYIDGPWEPLYPFGFGLSYTTFEYSDLQVRNTGDAIFVQAQVKNSGNLAGEEVAQCYVRDLVASRVRPIRELKGFSKLLLQPGESCQICFEIKHAELGFYGQDMEYMLEPGGFDLWVGPHSAAGLHGQVIL